MRDPKRIKKILKRLEKIWGQYPDLRLGQLIENVNSHNYYWEDEELIKKIEDFYKGLK